MASEITVEVNVSVECSECEKPLEARCYGRAGDAIEVTPCEFCIDAAREEGHRDGFADAEEEHNNEDSATIGS